jgi:hypothetical protein
MHRGGNEGIIVTEFRERKYVVTGYQAFGQRFFELPSGHAVTRRNIRLDIKQQDGGPPGRRATLAKIDFVAGAENQIGLILPRQNHNDEFELDVTLPVADFDLYWNILQDSGPTHLSCRIAVPPGEEIATFDITSPKDAESTSP